MVTERQVNLMLKSEAICVHCMASVLRRLLKLAGSLLGSRQREKGGIKP